MRTPSFKAFSDEMVKIATGEPTLTEIGKALSKKVLKHRKGLGYVGAGLFGGYVARGAVDRSRQMYRIHQQMAQAGQ